MNERILTGMNFVAGRRMLIVALAAVAGCFCASNVAEANYGRTARLENDTYALTHAGWTYAYYAAYYNPNDPNLTQGYVYASSALGYADYLWNTAYYGYFDGSVAWADYQYAWRIQMTYSYYASEFETKGLRTTYTDSGYYSAVYLYYAYLSSYYTTFVQPPYEPQLTPEFAKLLALHNGARAGLGFAPLTVDADLMEAAQEHADWMLANATESPFGPAGRYTVKRRANLAGYRPSTKISQNVLYGYETEEEVFAVWYSRNTGEMINIRDLKWDHVGFGVAGVGDDKYWCAVYATKRN